MKKYLQFTIYFLILLFGQFLFASVSFAEDCSTDIDCGENAKCESGFCVSDDSSFTPAESSNSGGGSSSGGSADGGVGFTYTGVDQRCWTKDDCEVKAFGTFVGPNDETKEACKMEKDSSNKLIGFCLPGTTAKMGVNWGEAGNQPSTFAHIGEFIKWIYRYGIVVASILAVMMIIKAGFDWIMSGGNQEMISGAHKKIGNALMGLFLAVMAYFILNLINPYLVNFRLPQIWMINTAGLVPPYCDLAKDKKFYFAKETSSEEYKNQYSEGQQKGFKTYDDAKPACGKEYYVEGSGGLTCSGTVCSTADKSVCLKGKCVNGMLIGAVDGTFGPVGVPAVDSGNNIKLLALCKSEGKIKEVKDVDYVSNKNGDLYKIPYVSSIETICNDYGGLAGFYLGVEVNDETGGSVNGWFEGMPWTGGTDDWHAVGQTAPRSHDCSVNLSTAFQKKYYSTVNCGPGNMGCSCAYVSVPTVAFIVANDPKYTQNLISLDELKNGYLCNIHITRTNFPAVANGMKWPSLDGMVAGTAVGGVVGTFIFPGVGSLAGLGYGLAVAPTAEVLIGFWNWGDDPTSCRDKN